MLVCAHPCIKASSSVALTLCFETRSITFTWSSLSWLGQLVSNYHDPSISFPPHIRMASTCPHARYFYITPVDFTQVLLLSWQALYWLSHIPSSVLLILCVVPLTSVSLIFMLIFIRSFYKLDWIWPLLVFLRSSDASLRYWLSFGYIFNINISNHKFPS